MPAYRPIEERLFSRVTIQEDGCWTWRGAKRSSGVVKHGLMGVTAYTVDYTHRVSWVIHNGSIPEGMFVLHKCDVGECVNPEHLFLGTQADNVKDMHNKGRSRGRHSATKTTEAKSDKKESGASRVPIRARAEDSTELGRTGS